MHALKGDASRCIVARQCLSFSACLEAGERMVEGANGADREQLEVELARLRQEHRDLDVAIEALQRSAMHDQLQLARLKKRKLALRDRIGQISDSLTPDIIA
jgi:hypothetical protein